MDPIAEHFLALSRQDNPRIILIEGPNGSGKSTIAKWLMFKLRGCRIHANYYPDPGGTIAGEAIRKIVKDPKILMTPEAQFLAFSAARCQLAALVKEQISLDRYVILDRWWPSSLVYQGLNGVSQDLMIEVFSQTANIPIDSRLSFVLNAPANILEERVRRAQNQDFDKDRFESKGSEFMQAISGAYDDICSQFSFSNIDTATNEADEADEALWEDRDIVEVQEEIFAIIKRAIPEINTAAKKYA